MKDLMHSGGKVRDTTKEVEEMLGPSAAIMRWMGLWQPPGGEPAGVKLVFALTLDVMFLIVIVGGLAKVLLDPPPTDSLLEVVLTIASSVTWGVRNVSILLRQSRLQQLILDVLNMRKQFTENGADFRKSFQRRAMIGSALLVGIPMLGIPMWLVEPALAKTVVATSENTTTVIRKTPLVMWMPMDTQLHPNYEITYIFQLFLICTVVNANIVIDIFFSCLIINVTADIAVLNNNIANMRLHKEDGFTKDLEKGEKISKSWEEAYKSKKSLAEKGEPLDGNTDPSEQLYRTLVKNIQHHQILMSIISDLESIMSKSSVLMLVVNSVNICSQGIGFVDGFRPGAKKTTVLKRFLTFPAYVNQTAHFCWYGEDLIDQSERLLDSAFNCGWADADRRFCSGLRIFMLQVCRPLKLQMGKIFTLSRNLFLQILNTSYTIFNMFINF